MKTIITLLIAATILSLVGLYDTRSQLKQAQELLVKITMIVLAEKAETSINRY